MQNLLRVVTVPPQMLSLLFALQYKCIDTFYIYNMKYEYGGICPDDVACSKRDAKDAVLNDEEDYSDDIEVTGKYAECAVGSSQEECDEFCKEACKMVVPAVQYTII